LRNAALILAALLLAVMAAGGVLLWLTGQFGPSQVATANVDGLEYGVSAARSLQVPPELVSRYGTVASTNAPLDLDGTSVYSILGIDPALVLLMKLKPGAHDDLGLLGDYALLVRGSGFEELCPYFDPFSEGAPTVCE
jgi:hypothetical protein